MPLQIMYPGLRVWRSSPALMAPLTTKGSTTTCAACAQRRLHTQPSHLLSLQRQGLRSVVCVRQQIGVINLRTGSIVMLAVIGRLHHQCTQAGGRRRAPAVEVQRQWMLRQGVVMPVNLAAHVRLQPVILANLMASQAGRRGNRVRIMIRHRLAL